MAQGRLVSAILTWHNYDQDPKWLRVADQLCGGLSKIALRNGDRAWFHTVYKRDGWGADNTPSAPLAGAAADAPPAAEPEQETIYNVALPLRAFSEWYAASGDKSSLEMAHRLANFVLKDAMWDGSFNRERGIWRGHFHTFTMGLMGILEYGIVAQDANVLRLVQNAYEHGRQSGIPRIGFFEAVRDTPDGDKGRCDEACAVADMTRLAIRLSEIGVGDYWEDADQFARNHLVEHQLIDRALLEAIIAAGPAHQADAVMDVTDEVLERNIGAFASGADPTWVYAWWTMCCNANAPLGLYKCWESIVRCHGDTAQINLLLNRASPWLDVDSYLPYEGKVVLHIKSARQVHVRLPSMVERKSVQCFVNDKQVPLEWLNHYLSIGPVAENDVVTITFPMVETNETWTEKTYGRQYQCRFRYNTLVDIAPRGDRPEYTEMGSDDGALFAVNMGYPIYRRDHYQATPAPLKQVSRYVSPILI